MSRHMKATMIMYESTESYKIHNFYHMIFITITLVNASGAIFNLFKDKAIASKATTELLTQPLIVEGGKTFTVQSSKQNLHLTQN